MVQYAVIATPAVDGKVYDLCATAISQARIECIHAHIFTAWAVLSGCAYVSMARNKLVQQFLDIPEATDLVFIDADVGFPPEQLATLLQHDADVVAGVYPYKSEVEGYPVLPFAAEGHDGKPLAPPLVDERTGLVECAMAPTGFMRIRRQVFEKMREHFGEDALRVVEREHDGAERIRYLNFFDTRQIGDQFYGEDVHFCKQWREMGGKILVDPDMAFSHGGTKHWRGNWSEHLQRQPGGRKYQPEPDIGGILAEVRKVTERAREGLPELNEMAARLETGSHKPVSAPGNGSEATTLAQWEPGPELLLGCGASRYKIMIPAEAAARPEWHSLTTLDMNREHDPDVVHDLELLPYPFDDDQFSEIHAYEVLEHLGRQGDWRNFFAQFAELWRILRPGGYLVGTVPAWDSEWAWGDPSHQRVLTPGVFAYLCQEQYRAQIGTTMMTDFRYLYKGDFRIASVRMDEAQFSIDPSSGRARRSGPSSGRFTRFMLQAIKPSTYSDADLELAKSSAGARAAEYEGTVRKWHESKNA